MFPHRTRYAFLHICHLQRNESDTSTKQSTALGTKPKDVASDSPALHRHRFTCRLHMHLLLLLERRSQEGREGSCLLHCILSRVLRV